MWHPLRGSPRQLRQLAMWTAVSTALLMTVLTLIGRPLNTPAAPWGIVSFEVAYSPARASQILDSWDEPARHRAQMSLWVDYLFIPAYSTLMTLVCLCATGCLRRRAWRIARLGVLVAWGQWIAGALDTVENATLLVVLAGPVTGPWPQVAAVAALTKFTLLALGAAWALYGLAARFSGPPHAG